MSVGNFDLHMTTPRSNNGDRDMTSILNGINTTKFMFEYNMPV